MTRQSYTCRAILPKVQRFTLACRGLAICPQVFTGAVPLLHLLFCQAEGGTLDVLKRHTHLTSHVWQDIPPRGYDFDSVEQPQECWQAKTAGFEPDPDEVRGYFSYFL